MNTAVFFAFASTRQRKYAGPLGSHLDEFIAALQAQGYARHTIRCKAGVVADFSHWLNRQHLGANAADAERSRRFLEYRERTAQRTFGDAAALRQIQQILLTKQVVKRYARLRAVSERERVEQDFRQHLLQDKGLAPSTPACYLRHISRFLRERFGNGPLHFDQLVLTDITRFIQRHAHGYSHSRVQQSVTALRAFLGYLRLRGLSEFDLGACVPRIARWSLAGLPVLIRPEQITRALRSCNRRTAIGRRDYAILLLLARLGLRAGEVTALTLDAINWQQGVLTIRGKGGAWTHMPLPHEVGEAIVAYLEDGRPVCADRHVFVRMHAPRRGIRNASSISVIASRALARARVEHPRAGAHVFRHAQATEMLRQGASLAEIGELLRHQHPDTTRIYAKVDVASLRALAMPWPGGAA